ncbi:MAG TPA: YbaB/EbfC family nucleoid-associated protein, partial [Gaiellaceae bacterium]|nr:YbaB/EbfC family nucleoid-associated protein [Gaiellaceae bacterium]
ARGGAQTDLRRPGGDPGMSSPGGMDINKMMKQVQQMQADMARVQEELANETVEASAGGGMVTVTATGSGEIKAITIAPEAIDPDDPELLADMILGAVNEALRSANDLAQSRLGGMAGGLGLPGL